MENTASILTIKEVAAVLRCSRAHVQKALVGKIAGVPQLAHVNMGRRKLVRKERLELWMEEGKTGGRTLR
jgi:excisionase family DNA binding protein